MESMTLDEFKERARNQVFTMCFTKRTDSTRRVMNARFGVKKHLKGGVLRYDPAEKGLLGCYDLKGNPDGSSEAGYKMINLQAIIWLKWGGKVWGWDPKRKMFLEQDPAILEREAA